MATQTMVLVGTEANQMPKYQLGSLLVLKKPSENVPFSLRIVEFPPTRTVPFRADLAAEVKLRRERKRAARVRMLGGSGGGGGGDISDSFFITVWNGRNHFPRK